MTDIRNITDMIGQVEFTPTDTQRKTKAKLMGILADNPLYSIEDLTVDVAVELTKDRRLYKWNKENPQFIEWLRNRNEFRQRLEHLIDRALDRAEQILANDEAKEAAQVALIKILMEMGNRFPTKTKEVKYLDAAIGKMSDDEVRKYIEKHMEKAIPIKPLELDAPEEPTNDEELTDE